MDITVKGRNRKSKVAPFLVIWAIIGLQVVWCEDSRHQICVTSEDTQVNVTCPRITDRIEIRRVRYSLLSSLRGSRCNRLGQTSECLRHFNETKSKPAALLRACSSQHHCSLRGRDITENCDRKNTNHMRIEFDCVPENEFVDLCGSDNRTITQRTHLAVFPKPGDGPLDCNCEVSGGQHNIDIRAVHVELPNVIHTENCSEASLTVTWNKGSRTRSGGVFLDDGDRLSNRRQNTTIRLLRVCNNSYTPVWLQIIPDPKGGNKPTLVCKRAKPLLLTQCSDAPTDTFSADPADEINAGGIAGAFVGGVALGICLAVIGVIIVWKQREKETAEPNSDKDSKVLPGRASRSLPAYEEVTSGGVRVENGTENVANTCTDGEEADDGGYQSIRETNQTVKRDHRQPRGGTEIGCDTFGAPLKSAPDFVGLHNVYGESDGNGSSGYHVLETVRLPDPKGAFDVPSYTGSDVTDGMGTPQESPEGGPGDYHVLEKFSEPEIPPGRAEEWTSSDGSDGKHPKRTGGYDHIDSLHSLNNSYTALEKP